MLHRLNLNTYIIIPNLVAKPLGLIATEVIDAVQSNAQLDTDGVRGKDF